MDTNQLGLQTQPPDVSPLKAFALMSVGLAAALLGLTTVDVAQSRSAEKRQASADRSAECIVASALFVGASKSQDEAPVH